MVDLTGPCNEGALKILQKKGRMRMTNLVEPASRQKQGFRTQHLALLSASFAKPRFPSWKTVFVRTFFQRIWSSRNGSNVRNPEFVPEVRSKLLVSPKTPPLPTPRTSPMQQSVSTNPYTAGSQGGSGSQSLQPTGPDRLLA